MKRFLIALLTASSAVTSSHGLSIAGQKATTMKTEANLTAPLARLDPVLVRPMAGKGTDKVHFGLRAMNFYGADLKHHTFALDVVLTIKWKDPRVVGLIPKGLSKLSMSWKHAEKLMWMPGVLISNRDIDKYEIISASVTVYRSGHVRRVERANCRVMKKFALEGYPFDTQDLAVNVASSKYMLDEVELVPDKKAAGVEEDIWGLYDLEGWSIEAIQKHDGDLKKSRGILHVTVQRSLEKYSQDHLMPAFIVLVISWAVFYFPFANPFITARLALSILALLQFTNLMVKSSKELPGSAPFNWNDLFNQQIQTLMSITIVLNIASEVCFHQFHNEALARGLNKEAKVLMPMLSIINIVLILGGCKYHWMTLDEAISVTKAVLFVLITAYVVYAIYSEIKRCRETKEEDTQAQLEDMRQAAERLKAEAQSNYKATHNRARSSVV